MDKRTITRITGVAFVVILLFLFNLMFEKPNRPALINIPEPETTLVEPVLPIEGEVAMTTPRDTVYIYVEVDLNPDSVFVIPILKFIKPVADTLKNPIRING